MAHLEEGLIEPTPSNVTYESYLQVRGLLKLQQPLSSPSEQDEMLFIVIHQVYELWFKQILHEVDYASQNLRRLDIMSVLRTLNRINTIQQTLTKQVDILETMTPNDFNRFRNHLNPASGFQSFQFRFLEFKLGAKDESYLAFHKHHPECVTQLQAALDRPTLYDDFLYALAKKGLPIPEHLLNRDVSKAHTLDAALTQVFVSVYKNCEKNYDIYMALEALADLDERFLLWRFRHVAMVGRMIGTMRGTGGSSGVAYLTQTLSKRFFPEIWDARNFLNQGY